MGKYNCRQREANKRELILIHLLRLAILAAFLAVRLQIQSGVICCSSESHPLAIPFLPYIAQCSSLSVVIPCEDMQ